VQGSPARVCGDGDTVFGSGAAAALDLFGCVGRMVSFAETALGCELPPASVWIVSRVDVTANLELPSLSDVRAALAILRGTEGGRYRVSATAGDTVYHGGRSKLRKGKAYAKGPHLRHLLKQETYTGRRYDSEEVEAASRLLRLELTLGREWWRRAGEWCAVTAQVLRDEWESYYGRMLGGVGVMCESVGDRVRAVAKTEGRARAALACWHLIQQFGWEQAKALHSKNTWYRHLRVLHAAGLGDADISQGRVVPLRRVELSAALVTSWEQLQTSQRAA
jgi:hypothetical protein